MWRIMVVEGAEYMLIIFLFLFIFIGIPYGIYVYSKIPSEACPKCSFKVKLNGNTGKCDRCKTRFVIRNDGTKEVL